MRWGKHCVLCASVDHTYIAAAAAAAAVVDLFWTAICRLFSSVAQSLLLTMCCKNRCCEYCRMASSMEDIRSPRFWRAVLGEGLGTMLLVVLGCGTCMGGKDEWEKSDPTTLQISMAFGLAVATVVWSLAHVSGGHVNPAVTIAMLATRKVSLIRGLLYIFAQCAGALAGAGILFLITPEVLRGTIGMTTISKGVAVEQGFAVEFIVTFILVFTVFASVDDKRTDLNGSTPLTIGFSVTLCHVFAIKYTGSSMNPARTFGPAVITGIWADHWVYWCGPVLGGITAGMLYELLFASNASRVKARNYLLSGRYSSADYHSTENQQTVSQQGGVPMSTTVDSRLEHKTSLLKVNEEEGDVQV